MAIGWWSRWTRSRWTFLLTVLGLVAGGAGEAVAERNFTSRIPNGTLNDSNSRGDGCGHCHVLPSSDSLNDFGARWAQIGWGSLLASEDSDDDDVTNGWELGDPNGIWQQGQPDPGDPALITSPGQDGSVPPVLAVTPLQIDHFELQGENLSETFDVENIGGDCFGNPSGPCTLSFSVSTAEAWMDFDPAFGELDPLEIQAVDILFATGGLLGDYDGSASIEAADVWNSPQSVLVSLTVPEPSAASLGIAALLATLAVGRKRNRRDPS